MAPRATPRFSLNCVIVRRPPGRWSVRNSYSNHPHGAWPQSTIPVGTVRCKVFPAQRVFRVYGSKLLGETLMNEYDSIIEALEQSVRRLDADSGSVPTPEFRARCRARLIKAT